jgi:TATA-binding protein-associated factor Taf7
VRLRTRLQRYWRYAPSRKTQGLQMILRLRNDVAQERIVQSIINFYQKITDDITDGKAIVTMRKQVYSKILYLCIINKFNSL